MMWSSAPGESSPTRCPLRTTSCRYERSVFTCKSACARCRGPMSALTVRICRASNSARSFLYDRSFAVERVAILMRWSVTPDMAETTTALGTPACPAEALVEEEALAEAARDCFMMEITFRMATADPIEVPPNFSTFMFFFEAIGNQIPYQVQNTLSKCQSDTSQTLRNKPQTEFLESGRIVYAYAHASALVCRNNAGFFQDLYMHHRERKFDPEWLYKF